MFVQGYRAPCAFVLMYICSRPFVLESLCLVPGCDCVTNALASHVVYLCCELLPRLYDGFQLSM